MADTLKSEARVILADPGAAVAAFAARFSDHARLERAPAGTVIESPRFGRMDLSAEAGVLVIACASPTPSALAYARMAAADVLDGILERVAPPDRPRLAWTGAAAGAGALPFFREMTIVEAHAITPRMRRVVLAGDAAHFDTGALHARVLIPPAGRPPVWPHADEAGRMVWPTGADALVARVYTVRSVDRAGGTIAIDVVQHAGTRTPGADWARGVLPGDRVGLLGPGGAPFVPGDFNLFAGDETALPAIARMLERLPPQARAVACIEVADAGEEQALPSPAALDLRWLHRAGAPAGTTGLIEAAVAAVALPADGAGIRVFAGCEQATARRLRAHLTRTAGLPKDRLSIAAYWRLGHEGVDIGE